MQSIPLRKLIYQTIFPSKKVYVVFAAICVLSLLLPLLLMRIIGASEIIEVTTMYRTGGDMDYFGYITALAQGNFGEFNVYELHGKGLQTFPSVPLLLHAFLFKLFGPLGFWVADAVYAYLFYILLVIYLRMLGGRENLAHALSFILCCGVINQLMHNAPGFFEIFNFWGHRIPRPLVTELFFVALLVLNFQILRRQNLQHNWYFWFIYGSTSAIFVQSDIYAGFSVLIIECAIILYFALKNWKSNATFKGQLIALAAFVLCILPFVIQNLLRHPDVTARLGAFPIVSFSKFMVLSYTALYLVVLTVLAALLLFINRNKLQTRAYLPETTFIGFWVALSFAGLIALPLFVIAARQGIQLYHFKDRAKMFYGYAFLSVAVLYYPHLLAVTHRIASLLVKKYTLYRDSIVSVSKQWIAVALLCTGLFVVFQITLETHNNAYHVRQYEYKLEENYRSDFAELALYLKKELPQKIEVLGSFDHQANTLWQAFLGKHLLIPDAFTSNVSDNEIEKRCMYLCKSLGFSTDEFLSLIDNHYVQLWFLSCGKYQASKAHTFSALDQYTEKQQKRIQRSSIFKNWILYIPADEKQRLANAYEELAYDTPPKLDAILLTNNPEFVQISLPDSTYSLQFVNETFRLWTRK